MLAINLQFIIKNLGSIFIQILCCFLKPEFARDNDFISILQRVRQAIQHWNISKQNENIEPNTENCEEKTNFVTQVPEENSSLTKKIYFDVA